MSPKIINYRSRKTKKQEEHVSNEIDRNLTNLSEFKKTRLQGNADRSSHSKHERKKHIFFETKRTQGHFSCLLV